MAPVIVHHLEKSRGHRILWLFNLLEVEHEMKLYGRNRDTQLAPKELRSVHPLGKSPTVELPDGTILAESGAIIEYFVETSPNRDQFKPSVGTKEWRQYSYFMHYAEGSLMPLLTMLLVFHLLPQRLPWLLRPFGILISNRFISSYLEPQLKRNLAMIEEHLGENEFFAGASLSAADVQMCYTAEGLLRASQKLLVNESYPNLEAYVSKIHMLESFKKAVEEGGGTGLAEK